MMSDRQQFLEQINRLVDSHVLHGSESLCKLLQYLAHHALDHPGAPLKEYQIATEAFGRPADFDPQLDSTIRVQAGRLRLKLSEYYGANGVGSNGVGSKHPGAKGAGDPVLVELPKGTYILSFRWQTQPDLTPRIEAATPERENAPGSGSIPGPISGPIPGSIPGSIPGPVPGPVSQQDSKRSWIIAFTAVSVLLFIAVLFGAALLATRKLAETALARETEPTPAALQVFWRPFVTAPAEPWVIFSNAAFVGRPETGMRYYNAARDSGEAIWDHYTGVGEVLAVHNLDQAFGLLHRRIRVKRGSLFSLDDVRNNDLIFVGSPSENLTLMEIPSTRQFIFRRIESGPRKGDLSIVNVHPQPGEPTVSLASPSNVPLIEDYAIVGLEKGIDPARSVMILAGTTTFGTQAAVEYASRQDSVEKLLSHLSAVKDGQIKPFEVLLRVRITRGVPVETQVVAVREATP